MIVVICAKYKRNPSKTVDATERHDFLSQGRMTLKIYVKVKGHHMGHTFSC